VRIILYTGKGGVGKTTTSTATALRLADRGLKTLLLSTDAAHSLADALGQPLGPEPVAVAAGLDAAQLDTQLRFEAAWQELQDYLVQLLSQAGTDAITAEELTVLPGIEEVLALLAVHELAGRGRWDALVLDCAPTAETLRLLALPAALGWYLQRIFPLHRTLARGLRPLTGLLGRPGALPPDSVFQAVLGLAQQLAEVQALLTDPAVSTVRLVLTPEAVVVAEARRTFTALALYGYQVDEVVVNRIFPDSADGSDWQRSWVAAQRRQLTGIEESFAGLPLRRLPYRPVEPVGLPALRELADQLYGDRLYGDRLYGDRPGSDPAAPADLDPLLELSELEAAADGSRYQLSLRLPLAERGEVSASRSGDELVVTVAGHRRVLALPSVLRRCEVTGGSAAGGRLLLRFRPDPRLWPAP
jgi:arsenite-transporting ATPase